MEEEAQTERRLTYQFHSLDYASRLRVVLELGLVYSTDEGLSQAEAWKLWFARAKERGALTWLSWVIARYTVFYRMEKALFDYPAGGEALTEKLKTIQESREWKEWKERKL